MPRLSTERPRAAWPLSLALTALCVLCAPMASRAQGTPDGGAAVVAARSEAERAASALGALRTSRMALAAQSEALANEITRRKASSNPGLVPTTERAALDARLKQHQALVGHIAELDRQLSAVERVAADARAAHISLLDAEIARLRAGLAQGDAVTRAERFEVLRSLVAERTRLGAAPSARPEFTRVDPVRLPPVDPASVEPGEVAALADETRDHADHVRKQLEALVDRLGQLQTRRRMLRSALAFARDTALFVEDERVRRVVSARVDPTGVGEARNVGGERPTSGGSASGGEAASASRGDSPPQSGAAGADFEALPEAGANSDNSSGAGSDDGAGLGPGVLADTSPVPTADPPPVALPAGVTFEGGGAVVQPALVVQDAFDPQLLTADVGSLSPDALAEQIRRLEARRRELEKTVRQLDSRRQALDRLEKEGSSNGD